MKGIRCSSDEKENEVEYGWNSEHLRGRWAERVVILQKQVGILESLVSHLNKFGLYPKSDENLVKDLQEVE